MVRGCHRAAGIVVIRRPALLNGLSNQESDHVDEDHQEKCHPDVLGQKEEHRSPNGDGVVVPKIRRHEDVCCLAKPEYYLEEKANPNKGHADLGRVSDCCDRLPTDIQRGPIEARVVDHLLDNRGENST